MEISRKIDKFLAHLAFQGFFNYLDDETYIKRLYHWETGRVLDLKNPKSFNEKLVNC